MKRKQANIIIRKGAAHWDAKVLVPTTGEYVTFDFRKMTSRQRSDFHRELMNGFRASVK